MKNILKRLASLTLVLLLLASLSVTALAADPSITFKGFTDGFEFEPGSEYTETDLFQNFKGVMPGDVLTQNITFTNSAEDCDFVRLYMRAEAHSESGNPLSEEVAKTEAVATMTEFLSQLSMKVWNGKELIFEGSADELDGLAENVFLGTYRRGETGKLTVELTVPLTLENKFANRVGEVDWIFHVEAYNESQLSVRKVWSDGNDTHTGESITVNLLKDGEIAESVELNAENGWAHTFDRLVEGYTWTVEEAEVPEGYTVSYETVGTSVTITNTRDVPNPPPGKPLDIIVEKVWSSDDGASRPDSVTVALYDGNTLYDTVKLSKENNWTYHWENASVTGNWQVQEINIPKGYTPSYRVSGNTTTITNTYRLIQTGQLNWPIAVLGGLGVLLLVLGGAMMLTRRKRDHA